METIEVKLTLAKVCKHSVRYDNPESKHVNSVYVKNEAVLELGKPNEITITIKGDK